MPGQRHVIDSRGASYQDCAQLLLGSLATTIEVPREKDFGIDFFCQLRLPLTTWTETVEDLFAVQVKGGQANLRYGGLDSKTGLWKQYELTWLRSLATPLYLVQVETSLTACEVFSLWPIWYLLWTQPADDAFEIELIRQPPGTSSADLHNIKQLVVNNGSKWTIDLGAPILRLCTEDLNDAKSHTAALTVFRQWVRLDHLNLLRFQQFVPLLKAFANWTTNMPPAGVEGNAYSVSEWSFYDTNPGSNISRLSESTEPVVVNLGLHLEAQGDPSIENLRPVLLWLKDRGQLGMTGLKLLERITSDK